MSEETRYDLPYFGLRDLLMYLIPGMVVLTSLLLFLSLVPGVPVERLSQLGSFGVSVIAVFGAYFLGQAIYPLNYFIRRGLDRLSWLG